MKYFAISTLNMDTSSNYNLPPTPPSPRKICVVPLDLDNLKKGKTTFTHPETKPNQNVLLIQRILLSALTDFLRDKEAFFIKVPFITIVIHALSSCMPNAKKINIELSAWVKCIFQPASIFSAIYILLSNIFSTVYAYITKNLTSKCSCQPLASISKLLSFQIAQGSIFFQHYGRQY